MKKKLSEFFKYSFKVNKDFFKITPWSCILIVACYIVFMTYNILIPILTKKIYDNAYLLNESGTFRLLFNKYVIFFISAFIIKNVFEMLINLPRMVGIYTKAKYYFDRLVASWLTELPYIFFEKTVEMEELQRVNSVIQNNILQRIFLTFMDILFGIITVAGTIAILISFDVYLLPIAIISVVPFFITRILRGKELYEIKWYQAAERRNSNYLWGLFLSKNHVQEMKVYGSHKHIFDSWNSSVCKLYEDEFEYRKKDAGSLFVCNVIRIAGILLNIGLTMYLLSLGRLRMSEFIACLTSFYLVQNGVADLFTKISNQGICLKYAKDFYSFMGKDSEKDGTENISEFKVSISIMDVSFKYPNADRYALDGVSFSVNKSEKVAIVGENGSGKTTLVNMILGMYKPDTGQICIDSGEISRYSRKAFYKLVSLVPQNFCRYNMTLLENIIIGNLDRFTQEKDCEGVRAILGELGISHMGDNGKLNSLLGKEFDGGELSGGEWQKIAIARALYKDSEIFVLDEPTSALDPIIENEVLKDFLNITQDKTAIIISHRVGLCKYVDKIVVMRDGRIEGVGSHDELFDNNAYYRYLYTEQQKWYE